MTVLRVLVASPDDVAEERLIVKRVIDEINQGFRDWPVRLEFVGWEDTSPGIGSDPQDVINQQVGEDYDIFVGVIWKKFGTPTPRAGSGTDEEFQRAYRRWTEKPDALDILIFFSEVPFSLRECDPEQIALVKSFQDEVSGKGGLYRTYRSLEAFERELRIALQRQVLRSEGAAVVEKVSPPAPSARPPAPAREEEQAEESGFLDLLAIGGDNLARATVSTLNMTGHLKDLGERIDDRTRQIRSTHDTRLLQRHIDGMAADMMNFVQRLEGELDVFTGAYGHGLDAFERAVRLLPQFGESDPATIRPTLDSISGMKNSMVEALTSIETFRTTISTLPPATTALNRAKRRVSEVLDILLERWATAIRVADEVRGLLSDLLDKLDDQGQ